MTKMKAPRNVAVVNHGGKDYVPQKGVVEVPDDAVEVLTKHGFEVVKESKDKAA